MSGDLAKHPTNWRGTNRLLKQRVITALFMVLAFLGVLFLTPWYVFAVVLAVVFSIGAWEWSNLAGLRSNISRFTFVVVLIAVTALLGVWSRWFVSEAAVQSILYVACIWWALAFLWVQSFPASAVLWSAKVIRLLMGALVLIPAWAGAVFLRNQDSGAQLVLLCMLVVASADIGAYFSGRQFGKRKLAPAVSPGKSWEGVAGGMLLSLAVALGFNAFYGSSGWQLVLAIVLPAAMMSVVGDLLESMLKRVRGIKDSGDILPGHGGVLDRIDGVTAAVPFFSLSVLMLNWSL